MTKRRCARSWRQRRDQGRLCRRTGCRRARGHGQACTRRRRRGAVRHQDARRTGIDLLRGPRRRLGTVFVMITASASMETAVEALRGGAYDYIVKPVRNEEAVEPARADRGDARLERGKQAAARRGQAQRRHGRGPACGPRAPGSCTFVPTTVNRAVRPRCACSCAVSKSGCSRKRSPPPKAIAASRHSASASAF